MFSSRDPRKGEKVDHWEFLPVAKGEKIKAWLAGPVVGVEVHFMGKSKPCVRLLSDDNLVCPYCNLSIGTKWIGYTPLYLQFGTQGVVGIKQANLETVRNLPLHSAVIASRGTKYHSPPLIQPAGWTELPPTRDAGKLKPVDLWPWLIRLWKDEGLARLFEAYGRPTLPEVPPLAEAIAPPAAAKLEPGRRFNYKTRIEEAGKSYKEDSERIKAEHRNSSRPPAASKGRKIQ